MASSKFFDAQWWRRFFFLFLSLMSLSTSSIFVWVERRSRSWQRICWWLHTAQVEHCSLLLGLSQQNVALLTCLSNFEKQIILPMCGTNVQDVFGFLLSKVFLDLFIARVLHSRWRPPLESLWQGSLCSPTEVSFQLRLSQTPSSSRADSDAEEDRQGKIWNYLLWRTEEGFGISPTAGGGGLGRLRSSPPSPSPSPQAYHSTTSIPTWFLLTVLAVHMTGLLLMVPSCFQNHINAAFIMSVVFIKSQNDHQVLFSKKAPLPV